MKKLGAIFLISLLAASVVWADDIYVSCRGTKSIIKISGDTVSTFAICKDVSFGLAKDRFGNLYLSDPGTNEILKYAWVDGALSAKPTVFASDLNAPGDLVFDHSGNLYEVEASGNINRFVFSEGTLSQRPERFIDASPEHANLVGNRVPSNLAFDLQGNLYVSICIGGILKFTNTKAGLSNLPDKKPFSTVSRARQMAFDQQGNLFTTNHLAGEICVYKYPKHVSGLSGKPEIFSVENGLDAPIGVAIDSEGNLYVSNWGYGNGMDVLEYPNHKGVLDSSPLFLKSDLAVPIGLWCIRPGPEPTPAVDLPKKVKASKPPSAQSVRSSG